MYFTCVGALRFHKFDYYAATVTNICYCLHDKRLVRADIDGLSTSSLEISEAPVYTSDAHACLIRPSLPVRRTNNGNNNNGRSVAAVGLTTL